jgi:hypothetical protein
MANSFIALALCFFANCTFLISLQFSQIIGVKHELHEELQVTRSDFFLFEKVTVVDITARQRQRRIIIIFFEFFLAIEIHYFLTTIHYLEFQVR